MLPVPSSAEDEVQIVTRRVTQLGRSIGLPHTSPGAEEIRRVVTVFRELRQGVTEDGRSKVKSPERHAVPGRGDLRHHQRPRAGRALRRRRAPPGRRGRRHHRRGRPGSGVGRRGVAGVPGDRGPGAGRLERLLPRLPRGRPAGERPRAVRGPASRAGVGPVPAAGADRARAGRGADRGAAGSGQPGQAGERGGHAPAGGTARIRAREAGEQRRSGRSRCSPRSGRPSATRSARACRSGSATCRPRTSWP